MCSNQSAALTIFKLMLSRALGDYWLLVIIMAYLFRPWMRFLMT